MYAHVTQYAKEGAELRLRTFDQYKDLLPIVAKALANVLSDGHTLFYCGNGGSAAEAQHIAAELVGRFSQKERHPLPAIALTTDSSILTAVGNDYSFDTIFLRQLQALAKRGDALLAISTSGNSKNVVRAAEYAAEQGLFLLALTGKDGGDLAKIATYTIAVPSVHTPLIQEVHLALQHTLCYLIEEILFP